MKNFNLRAISAMLALGAALALGASAVHAQNTKQTDDRHSTLLSPYKHRHSIWLFNEYIDQKLTPHLFYAKCQDKNQ